MARTFQSFVLAAGITVAAAVPAFGDEALNFILKALAAEEQAPRKRANLHFRIGTAQTHQFIERVLPGRLHLRTSDGSGEQELYIIGDRLYQKTTNGWLVGRAATPMSTPLSAIGLFEHRLANVTESSPTVSSGIEQRVFVGTISWFSGRRRNEGEITVFIEVASSLPRRMLFKGICGGIECAFDHLISYEQTLTIEAPIP